MTNANDSRDGSPSWFRANAKTVFLAIDAVLVLVLVYFLISQAIFEIQVKRIGDIAEELAAQEAKANQETTGANRPSRRRPPDRSGSAPTTPTAQAERPSSPTAATSMTVAAARPSSPSMETTMTVATARPSSPSTEPSRTVEDSMARMPDSVVERLTGPGGRYEGLTREQLAEKFREMRERRGSGRERPGRPILATSATVSGALPSTGPRESARPGSRWMAGSSKGSSEGMMSGGDGQWRGDRRRGGGDWRRGEGRRGRGEDTASRSHSPGQSDHPSTQSGSSERSDTHGRSGPPGRPGGADDPAKKAKFDKLAQRGLFGNKPSTPRPPQLDAILGDSAIIDGKMLSVGDKVKDDKIVEIAVNKIVLETPDGKRREMAVLPGSSSERSSRGGPRPPSSSGESPQPAEPGQPASGRPSVVTSSMDRGGSMEDRIRNLPDSVFERMTRPGSRFEGMNREQVIRQMREMRERGEFRVGERRGRGGRGDRGGSSGRFRRD